MNYYVPDALPGLPRSVGGVANVEAKALRNRVDLRVAKLGLEAQAKAFGLTDQTRIVSDLEIVAGAELEREAEGDDIEKEITPQVELEFAIPIYDSGKARMRKAELSYLQAANVLAERAVNVRSEARGPNGPTMPLTRSRATTAMFLFRCARPSRTKPCCLTTA